MLLSKFKSINLIKKKDKLTHNLQKKIAQDCYFLTNKLTC